MKSEARTTSPPRPRRYWLDALKIVAVATVAGPSASAILLMTVTSLYELSKGRPEVFHDFANTLLMFVVFGYVFAAAPAALAGLAFAIVEFFAPVRAPRPLIAVVFGAATAAAAQIVLQPPQLLHNRVSTLSLLAVAGGAVGWFCAALCGWLGATTRRPAVADTVACRVAGEPR